MQLLHHASLLLTFWSYALQTTTYLINRMPSPVLKMKNPFEILFQKPTNYSKLHVFGCLCFSWLTPYTTNKLQSKSQSCVFIGYSNTQSVYLYFHPPSQKIYTFHHVHFVKTNFPYSIKLSSFSNANSKFQALNSINHSCNPQPLTLIHTTPLNS